jgi:hypothetical protein
MAGHENQSTIDAVMALAEEIARTSPESADKAMRIVELLQGLERKPDYSAIEDAIDAGSAGALSQTGVRNASLEVARTIRDEP